MSQHIFDVADETADITWTRIERLDSPPSPTTFLRDYVSLGRPVVFSGFADNWKAMDWTLESICDTLDTDEECEVEENQDEIHNDDDDTKVKNDGASNDNNTILRSNTKTRKRTFMVNVSPPDIPGDAVHTLPGSDGKKKMFIKPEERFMTSQEFKESLQCKDEVAYLSSQDDNLTSKFPELRSDVPLELPFAKQVFGSPLDAVNIWIGGSEAVSSTHKDPYHNLFTVVRGTKIFTLMPITDLVALDPRPFTVGSFKRITESKEVGTYDGSNDSSSDNNNDSNNDNRIPFGESGWFAIPEPDHPPVPWIEIDPTKEAPEPPAVLHPQTVEVHRGETLYLPPLVFHHVAQRAEPDGSPVICVNRWYDMRFGPEWALMRSLEAFHQAHHASE